LCKGQDHAYFCVQPLVLNPTVSFVRIAHLLAHLLFQYGCCWDRNKVSLATLAFPSRFLCKKIFLKSRKDMDLGENEPMRRIEKDFVSALPLLQFEGKIVLVEDEKTARKAVKELLREKILGFDTETRPCFQKGISYLVSLVQLCGKKAAYLFRLDYCGGVPVLFPIFENPNILKVGVAVKDDVLHLKKRAPFDDKGFVDASKFTRAARIENTGLRALTAYFLGGRISKAAQVSNWAAKQLSPQQIVYAATDAWTSRELFIKLQKIGVAPKKIEGAGASICGAIFDEPELLPCKKKSAQTLQKSASGINSAGGKKLENRTGTHGSRRRGGRGRKKNPAQKKS